MSEHLKNGTSASISGKGVPKHGRPRHHGRQGGVVGLYTLDKPGQAVDQRVKYPGWSSACEFAAPPFFATTD